MRTRHAVAGAVAVALVCALTLVGCGGGGGVGGSNRHADPRTIDQITAVLQP